MEDEDERREAAIASRPSLQPNFKAPPVTQAQVAKFQELHRRRLQIKAKSKSKSKVKGTSDKARKSHASNLDAKDFAEDISIQDTDDSSVSVLKGNTIKDASSLQQHDAAVVTGRKKHQKLHWGLDTKERWERKANM
ncbi:hypothetical protein NMG60_11006176 [Bertholletia excelsa]